MDNVTKIEARLTRVSSDITEVKATLKMLESERDEMIVRLFNLGTSQAEISRMSGVSYQRVHQIIRRSENES